MTATSVSHRERLADRLLRNWQALHPDDVTPFQQPRHSPPPPPLVAVRLASPVDAGPIDDSLTSLAWLQNLNVMKLATGNGAGGGGAAASMVGRNSTSGFGGTTTNRPTGAVQPIQQQKSMQHFHVDPNAVLDMTGCGIVGARIKSDPDAIRTSRSSGSCSSSSHSGSPPRLSPPPPPRCGLAGLHAADGTVCGNSPSPPSLSLQVSNPAAVLGCSDEHTMSTCLTKPSHSYATLICMAMNDAPDRRITLSGIYSWIIDNFPYYRTADPSWQNSIRHNLSLNKCFQRVQRQKSDPGKGSYWTINPEFHSLVDRDLFRKRGSGGPNSTSGAPPSKKACRRTAAAADTDARRQSTQTDPESSRTSEDSLFDFGADSLTDALDMSWSTILGHHIDIAQPEVAAAARHKQTSTAKSTTAADRRQNRQSQQHQTTSSGGSRRAAAASQQADDAELDELIRACAETDPAILDDLGDFGLGVDAADCGGVDDSLLDLTIYGIPLRPPDGQWTTLPDIFLGATDNDSRRAALNTPSPGPSDLDDGRQQQQQQQPHPWAEHRGALGGDVMTSLVTSSDASLLDTSLDAGGLQMLASSTNFDVDSLEEF